MVVSLWGDRGVGKTHLALTFPDPVYFFNLDYGLDALLPKFPDRDIRKADFPLSVTLDPGFYRHVLLDFAKALGEAIDQAGPGTIVFDQASQLWDIVQCVKLADAIEERKTEARKKGKDPDAVRPMGFDYADANVFMGACLRRVYTSPQTNAVFINGAKPSYSSKGEPTGGLEFRGFNQTPAIADVQLQVYESNKQTSVLIEKCRFDRELVGMQLANPDYPLLRALLLGGS